MLGIIPMKPKTLVVVIELVSRRLDQYKNNGLIFKLLEILSKQIWTCFIVWFLINHDFMLWLRNFYVYTRHTGEWFCKIAWHLDVYGQPICILQIGHMLLKWAVNNIWYTWFWGFNSKVKVNVLSYNLICLSFGMSRS